MRQSGGKGLASGVIDRKITDLGGTIQRGNIEDNGAIVTIDIPYELKV